MIDKKKFRRLKKSLVTVALRWRNWFRYPHPCPRGTSLLSTLTPAEGSVVWSGDIPDSIVLDGPQHTRFFPPREITFSAPRVAKLVDATAYGIRGHVITNQGNVLTDVQPEFGMPRNNHTLLHRGNMPEPEQMEGSIAILSSVAPRNYFHWLFDAMPRIQFLRAANAEPDLYYADISRAYQRNYLQLAGISADRVVPADKHRHIRAREMIVTSLPGDDLAHSYWSHKDRATCHFVRKLVLDASSATTCPIQSERPNIYIRRTGERELENETDLIAALEKRGNWFAVRLEEYPIEQQAAIFQNANIVLGATGAGLANLVFAGTDTTIIEIGSPNHKYDLFACIARATGIDHRYIMGEARTLYKNDITGNHWVSADAVMREVDNVNRNSVRNTP